MLNISVAEFNRLSAEGYNLIPLATEMLADLDTPLGTYLKLNNGPNSYFFESIHGGEKWGRYSIIGLPTKEVIRVYGNTLEITQSDGKKDSIQCADPLAEIEKIKNQYYVPKISGLPSFIGGLAGYFGYDTIGYIEPKLQHLDKKDPLETPDITLIISKEVVVFDNLRGRLVIVVNVCPGHADAYQSGIDRINEIKARLANQLTAVETANNPVKEEDFKSSFTHDGFCMAIDRIKRYIYDGDVMQAVLSQRFSAPFYSQPIDLYRVLRCVNPSPYMYYLDLEDFHIVGSSPEILVRLEGGEATVRPIAGTRRRGATDEEDKQLERELLADPKELAEHLMLIDLGRNDVGRIAESGTVCLTSKMTIERYSHVMHIVSNVVGRVRAGLSVIDVLRAIFPAGTVTGAPKVRAMEIIDELEPIKRGIYSGAVGYLNWWEGMDTAIAIRTAVIKSQQLHIQVGAGVVADSVVEYEWEETINKAKAIFHAANTNLYQ